MDKSVGFIGGGRITYILLEGLRRAGKFPQVVVSDPDPEAFQRLEKFPSIEGVNNQKAASQEFIFLALHPPVIQTVLNEIKSFFRPNSILISLAPVFTIEKLSECLGKQTKIVRTIPNAPSIVNAGYNPLVFSDSLEEGDRQSIKALFSIWGQCPEVAEAKLEAYVTLTAVGPTYFWFQWDELARVTESFGLTSQEVREGTSNMLAGALKTWNESELTAEEIMDLVRVKPLKEQEKNIRNVYNSALNTLYQKLKA